ncbi:MAG: hypothetical protein HY657_06825 [Acidobacteria bacterium]|nr:hypothetical protein [Acidobacteriota bacterium]
MTWLGPLAIVLLTPAAGFAQPPGIPQAPGGLLRVFVDCSECDGAYLRQQVAFVDYVRDRTLAEVHVLFSGQPTGNGGEEITLTFVGRERFDGVDDVLRYVSTPVETADETREGYTRLFVMGLIRYLARIPERSRVDLDVVIPEALPEGGVRDPWNFWVFDVGLSADASGEELTRHRAFSGYASAGRVTDAWKLRLGVNGRYNSSRFDVDDTTISSVSRGTSMDGWAIKSLGAHWGSGIGGSIVSSTYRVVSLGTVEYRLATGVSLDVHGGASLIRDQIYLARRGASDQEVLLRQRQLATGYDYILSIGLSFTFGSIHDSVVNSRFAGGSSGFARRY